MLNAYRQLASVTSYTSIYIKVELTLTETSGFMNILYQILQQRFKFHSGPKCRP